MTPCTVLHPSNHFTTQMKNSKVGSSCVSWMPCNGQLADRRVEDASSRMFVVVARFGRNGNLLPAKYEVGNTEVYSVLNGTGIKEAPSSNMEILLVDPLCSTKWITYDSSGSESLPINAVLAGHKANGIPLYTARMRFSIPQATEFSYGYYDPQNKHGYCDLWLAHEVTVMDVLCVVYWTSLIQRLYCFVSSIACCVILTEWTTWFAFCILTICLLPKIFDRFL